MYFDSATQIFDRPLDRDVGAILAGTALFVAFFIVYPAPIIDSAGVAASVLFGG
jgi:NADH-quinone oxidoreductase subunit N